MTLSLESEVSNAAKAIISAEQFLLTCHIHPDGDALGSTLAMAHALVSIGKTVYVTFPEPFVIPYSFRETLPGIDIVQAPNEIENKAQIFDVAMTFDCGSRTRLQGLDNLLSRASTFINVDHHLSNEGFGDINVIDAKAASSGSVVLALLDAAGIELTNEVAQCIYVALLTDTGRFQFSSTTSEVFEQARRLSEFELPIALLSRKLTEEDSFSFLQFAGNVMVEMHQDDTARLVSAVATIEMRQKYGVPYDQTEGLIEFVRRTRECDVACVIKEFEPSDYRISLRSLGEIDVCEIAKKFGGGGHRYAAGFSSVNSPDAILARVRQEVLLQRGG